MKSIPSLTPALRAFTSASASVTANAIFTFSPPLWLLYGLHPPLKLVIQTSRLLTIFLDFLTSLSVLKSTAILPPVMAERIAFALPSISGTMLRIITYWMPSIPKAAASVS